MKVNVLPKLLVNIPCAFKISTITYPSLGTNGVLQMNLVKLVLFPSSSSNTIPSTSTTYFPNLQY